MEDEDDIARLIMHHLELAGFRVRRPDRASDLIAEAEKERPALFILDLMLPEIDGYQLCRAIKARASLKNVPVLVLTARTGARGSQTCAGEVEQITTQQNHSYHLHCGDSSQPDEALQFIKLS